MYVQKSNTTNTYTTLNLYNSNVRCY